MGTQPFTKVNDAAKAEASEVSLSDASDDANEITVHLHPSQSRTQSQFHPNSESSQTEIIDIDTTLMVSSSIENNMEKNEYRCRFNICGQCKDVVYATYSLIINCSV